MKSPNKKASLSDIEKKVSKKKASKKKPTKKNRAKKKVARRESTNQARAQGLRDQFIATLLRPGMSQARAYMEVYGTKNYKSAENKARQMMARDDVQEALKNQRALMKDGGDVRKEWAVGALKEIAEANVLEFIGDDGLVMPVSELKKLPEGLQSAIREISLSTRLKPVYDEEGEEVGHETIQMAEIKLYDKIKAIETIAKVKDWIKGGGDVHINVAEKLQEAEQRLTQGVTINGDSRRTG